MLIRRKVLFFIAFIPLIFIGSCSDHNSTQIQTNPLDAVPTIPYSLIHTFPHDTTSFTEGFLFHDNQLFESTGSPAELKHSKSVFGIVDLKTGKIKVKGTLDRHFFGEGITFFGNKLYQLTYKDKVGFIYNAQTFKLTGKFWYENEEGWGLTQDGTNLIMSDGTNVLTFLDPDSLKVVKLLAVHADKTPIKNINELEYIKGFIYANVWLTDYIVKINPNNGNIVGKINLSALHISANKSFYDAEVMNGIAYDPLSNLIYITGKLWPFIYQIKI